MKKLIIPVVLGTGLIGLTGCGSDNNGNVPILQQDQTQGQGQDQTQQQEEDEGRYFANLQALNNSVARNPSGRAEIMIQGDEVRVDLNMQGLRSRGAGHPQFIYTEGECPTQEADTNGDGLIDHQEGEAVYGDIFLPLDENFENTSAQEEFPTPSNRRYNYSQRGSLARLLADLNRDQQRPQAEEDRQNEEDAQNSLLPQAEQENESDNQNEGQADAQEGEREKLNLAGKTIVVHGVPGRANLPTSVSALEGRSRAESLPIACGVIQRIEEEQGQDEQAPQGEQEGQTPETAEGQGQDGEAAPENGAEA
jgi:hypothetical protein